MSAITLETTNDKYLISIDRTLMDKPAFRAFFERLRVEFLADKMNTDEADLMALSEEVKANWWAANQERILDRISRFSPDNQ
jgi:hypothetical protein